MRTHTYLHMHTHTHTNTYTHAHMHTHIHVHCEQDGILCLHDVNETRLANKITLGTDDTAINSLAFHPSNPNLLYASVSSDVKAVDLRTGPGVASTYSHNSDEVNQVHTERGRGLVLACNIFMMWRSAWYKKFSISNRLLTEDWLF